MLQGRTIRAGTPECGEAFETYMAHELLSYRDYFAGESVSFWRSTLGFEVDFILGDHTALEIKAKGQVSLQDLKSLKALAEEKALNRYLVVSFESRRRKVGTIIVLPWRVFLDDLWDGDSTLENRE